MWLSFQGSTCNPPPPNEPPVVGGQTWLPAAQEAPPSPRQVRGMVDTSQTQRPAPPTHTAFVTPRPPGLCFCMPRSRQPALTPWPAPRGSWTCRDPSRDQYPLPSPALSLPGEPPGGSRQTTLSPGTPGSGGAFEGKVHFVNQPIVGLPSAGSSSPAVSLGAIDTDVNCQGCPPPPSWGILQARHKGLCRNAPHWPLARTKIATPSELPKLDWILHHEDWLWRLQLTRTGMADT